MRLRLRSAALICTVANIPRCSDREVRRREFLAANRHSSDESRNSVNNAPPSPMQNHLLAELPEAQRQQWWPQLEYFDMPLGRVMYEAGGLLTHVYFPTTAIVSLLYVMENGASGEIAVVGNEGIVGISLFMGGGSTPSRAVVQRAGHGYRLSAH